MQKTLDQKTIQKMVAEMDEATELTLLQEILTKRIARLRANKK